MIRQGKETAEGVGLDPSAVFVALQVRPHGTWQKNALLMKRPRGGILLGAERTRLVRIA